MSDAAATIRKLLFYDPETGDLIWSKNAKIAGCKTAVGYCVIGANLGNGYKVYQAHRLVWLHQKGEWPVGHIDHKDRNKLNNRIENLADVTVAENNINKTQRIGKSGIKGVHWSSYHGKWNAQTVHNGKKINFGCFDTIEEAKQAYENGMLLLPKQTISQKTKDKKRSEAPVLTQQELKRLYFYDLATGYFFKIYKDRTDTVPAGYVNVYRRISVNAVRYSAHHLAYLYMIGRFPDHDKDVDHIDGNKDNNSFKNLREVSTSLNCMNRKSKNGDMRGVRQTRNKIKRWEARLRVGNKLHQIGTYDTKEEAVQAYKDYAASIHGENLVFSKPKPKFRQKRADDKKQAMLDMPTGSPKPKDRSPLSEALANYTKPNNRCYDADFEKKLRIIHPTWFLPVGHSSREKKQRLLALPVGCPKPKYKSDLHYAIEGYTRTCFKDTYDAEFDKLIREKQPQWFVTHKDIAAERKNNFLLLPPNSPKPDRGTSLSNSLRNYTTKTNKCYDLEFSVAIREQQPHWFARQHHGEDFLNT